MKEILPDIFAIEVPEDAKNVAIKNGTYVKWITIDGNPFTPLNDPGKFRALFTTKDCSEQQAEKVVAFLRSHNLTGKNYLLIKRQP